MKTAEKVKEAYQTLGGIEWGPLHEAELAMAKRRGYAVEFTRNNDL